MRPWFFQHFCFSNGFVLLFNGSMVGCCINVHKCLVRLNIQDPHSKTFRQASVFFFCDSFCSGYKISYTHFGDKHLKNIWSDSSFHLIDTTVTSETTVLASKFPCYRIDWRKLILLLVRNLIRHGSVYLFKMTFKCRYVFICFKGLRIFIYLYASIDDSFPECTKFYLR